MHRGLHPMLPLCVRELIRALVLLAGLLVTVVAGAQDSPRLRVGFSGSVPFVIADERKGLSLDVWEQLASAAELQYDLQPVSTVDGALLQVENRQLDVAVGPISITAKRAASVFFTQPYFQSSLAIAAPPASANFWNRLTPFFSGAFFIAIATLLLVLLGVGVLFWVAERKRNEEMFPNAPVKGIGSGLWLALVTMTTVGYGDKAPITPWGRVIAGVWMILSMLTVSSLTAGIATALTVASLDRGAITSEEDLRGRKVAVVGGTIGEQFARAHGARLVKVASVEQGIEQVARGNADALVHDRPVLQYALLHHDEAELLLSEAVFEPQGYGFATNDEALSHRLTVALLRISENGTVDDISRRWLDSPADEPD